MCLELSVAPLLYSFLLLIYPTSARGADSCSNDIEPLISGQKYRVHDQFFSSDSNTAAAHLSRLNEESWCSDAGLSLDSQPWLQVEFGNDVTLHAIQTAGRSEDYVITFQVHVGNSSSELQPIPQPDSSGPMVFNRSQTPDIEESELTFPVTTRVLRIVAISWSPSDQVCLRVEALGCLVNPTCENESLLTSDAFEGILASITASTEDDSIENVVNNGNEQWCSDEPFSEGPAPYIQLNFTTDVSLSYMLARGDEGVLFDAYVTGFQLQVLEDSGNFTSYGVTDQPTIFTTDDVDNKLYTFWRPARGQVFRFNIISGETFLGDFCWNIQLYGCLNGSAPVRETSDASPNVPMATTDSMSDEMPTTEDEMLTTEDVQMPQGRTPVAAIGGGVAAAFVVLGILLITIVAIVICVTCPKTSTKKQTTNEEDSTLAVPLDLYHKFDNSIYGEEVKSPSPETTSNPAYGSSPMNTYEPLQLQPPGGKPESLEYAYAETSFVAKVNVAKPRQDVPVTSGFKGDDGKDVESDPPDVASTSRDQRSSSLVDNPLYGVRQ